MKKKITLNRSQSGFTLVELMVAAVLGLVLIAGILQLFQGSNQNYTMQSELADIQEKGRFALNILKKHIRQGAWSDSYHDISYAIDFDKSDDGESSDRVAVTFIASEGDQDCSGTEISSGKVINQFFVEDNQLMCQGNGEGSGAVALVDSVINFQVLYGIENIDETNKQCRLGIVHQYVNKTSLTDETKHRIMSVKVGLVIETTKKISSPVSDEGYQLLDVVVEASPKTAGKVVRVFQETILMPNAIYTTVGSAQAVLDCM